MKLVNIAKTFAKPIGFGAAGIAALGIAISSVLNRDQNDTDDYEPGEDGEDGDDYEDEPEETSEEPTVDDAE